MYAHEEPFEYKYCEKVCYKHCNLVGHTRTHTGERPFKCYHCGKDYSRYVNFLRRLEIHTGMSCLSKFVKMNNFNLLSSAMNKRTFEVKVTSLCTNTR